MAFLETFGFVTYASMRVWHAAVMKGLREIRNDHPQLILIQPHCLDGANGYPSKHKMNDACNTVCC